MKILKDLHTGRKKFSRVERMHFFCKSLEEELKVYYLSYTETVDRPYSEQEQEIIVRIIKMLIRRLGVHPSFSCLAGEVQDVSPKIRMMWKSGEERRKEQTDEIRLKHTNLYSYNPLSKKYKARKEELLRNLKREF